MNLYIITENWINNFIELMWIVDLCIKSKFLSLGTFRLDIVLPEKSVFSSGSRTHVGKIFLVNSQVVIRITFIVSIILVFTVNIIELTWRETVENFGYLISNTTLTSIAADGVHMRTRFSSVPDHIQSWILDRSTFGKLRNKQRI